MDTSTDGSASGGAAQELRASLLVRHKILQPGGVNVSLNFGFITLGTTWKNVGGTINLIVEVGVPVMIAPADKPCPRGTRGMSRNSQERRGHYAWLDFYFPLFLNSRLRNRASLASSSARGLVQRSALVRMILSRRPRC